MAERLFRVIGRPDLVDDPRFRTNADRLHHVDELDAIVGAFIARRTQDENVAFFKSAKVTIGPINDAAKLVVDYPDPDMGLIPMHAVVPRLHDRPGSIRTPAPTLGQHNRELFGRIGITGVAFDGLVEAGVVRGDVAVP
jgi:crotonobetainyl-CoA:carnitine CoA-transferase CaiB-like acyl-CoA transferase